MAGSSEKSPVQDVEDLVYEAVNKMARGVEGLLGRLESVGKQFEAKTTPVNNVTVTSPVDPAVLAEQIATHLKSYRVRKQAVDSPVASVTGTPLSREQLLREVYRFNVANTSQYLDWAEQFDDMYAVAKGYRLEDLLENLGYALGVREEPND